MKDGHEIYHRRSIRLKEYDYSREGAYFITIVTQGRECLLGQISNGEMQFNAAGDVITGWWRRLPDKFPSCSADVFVLMPNHFHGIIVIEGNGQTHRSARTESERILGADPFVRPDGHGLGPDADDVRPDAPVSQMVQWFKTMTTNAYIDGVKELGWPPFKGRLWQRNYYEHIIRNSADHAQIYKYIESNPWRWIDDEENSAEV